MPTSVPQTARIAAIFLAALLYLIAAAPAAHAQEEMLDETVDIDIPAQQLTGAMIDLSRQTGIEVLMSTEMVEGFETQGVQGEMPLSEALTRLLDNTQLGFSATGAKTVSIQPLDASVGRNVDGALVDENGITQPWAGVEEIIVTGQKRAERLQDVPIAISAFTAKDLEAQKIEGGFDLLKAIPNVTFSKGNFSGYNFSIRGIGTKAVSATTDPGVAVAFNNTTLIHNRLFEQEYFDVERVEVLRGPQGTLYGRNATSGVINVLSNRPNLDMFEGEIKLETGNYDAERAVGMLNVPIVDGVLGVRLAGAMTRRDGFDYNEITQNNVNGRDLWSGRITIGFQPNDRLRANLLWEHFEEDDDRSRTGKQLCHHDPGLTRIGDTDVVHDGDGGTDFVNARHELWANLIQTATFSQGCKPGSLYTDEAYGTPNGVALPFVFPILALGSVPVGSPLLNIGWNPVLNVPESALRLGDPYGGLSQSRDIRTIASVRDPLYRAEANIFELSVDFDLTDSLLFTSQTVYNDDEVFSFQDFNRFNSFPAFTDTSILELGGGPSPYVNLAPGGVFCDPQIGCSDRLAGFDISQAKSRQFSQELRLQSAFNGPVNFSLGTNYTRFKTLNDYYVFYNALTILALSNPFYEPDNFEIDFDACYQSEDFQGSTQLTGGGGPVPAGSPTAICPWIDPQPIDTSKNFQGEGHNYFRSKNPYELDSSALFGELYWNVTDALKLTAGLRYTADTKTFTPVPSQVLLAPGVVGGGTVSKGYPEKPDIVQRWGEWTGRLVLDWQPDPVFGWQDETLLYASLSRGYKAGGANPPTPGFATREELVDYLISVDGEPFLINQYSNPSSVNGQPILQLNAVDYGPTFEPEFINAFEIGAKNTLFGGAMTLNATAFYYDYTDYQISQIKDRTAVNENFDATIWGLELETLFAPTPNLNFIANVGYLRTKVADGESSIDLMNRTQGNPDYVVAKPWAQLPSNCVVPLHVMENWVRANQDDPTAIPSAAGRLNLCSGYRGFLAGGEFIDPLTNDVYNPANYPELNGGAGIRADLSGNELPNAPRFTANAGMEYGLDVFNRDWRLSFRTDVYWQDDSYHRIYNFEPYDKLQSWYNVNVAVRLFSDRLGLDGEFYVKNLLDKSPVTDAFLNSDDTGLTTNVFTLDPRLVGISIRKRF